ncbi:HNH endonuclease family protein [Kitasatospora sp. NPDC048298]|uniref:HNH endonuclease family protein n=1 Tax=Kitasatospora sp. NPDC048298 TaxID=3364049 RepID=UPI00371C72B8
MRLRPAITALAVTALLGITAAPAHAAPQHRVAGETVTTTLYNAIDILPIAQEDRTGYVRTKFKIWVDEDGNGCDTRKEVLIAQAVEKPTIGPNCVLTGGVWLSPYDNLLLNDAKLLDIDHVVPLAEAWDSGASNWSPKERERYGNDLRDPRALLAVSAKTNRSKSDKDPADWMPPVGDFACTYVSDWVVVKTRWGLSIDQREADALHRIAAGCEDTKLQVVLAR